MSNAKIRQAAKEAGVYLWQIADALGVSEFTLCRKLRREFPADETKRVLEIIDRIAIHQKEV